MLGIFFFFLDQNYFKEQITAGFSVYQNGYYKVLKLTTIENTLDINKFTVLVLLEKLLSAGKN